MLFWSMPLWSMPVRRIAVLGATGSIGTSALVSAAQIGSTPNTVLCCST